MEEEGQSNKPHPDNLGRRVANSVRFFFRLHPRPASEGGIKVHAAILQNSLLLVCVGEVCSGSKKATDCSWLSV